MVFLSIFNRLHNRFFRCVIFSMGSIQFLHSHSIYCATISYSIALRSFLFMPYKRRYAKHSSRDKYSIEQTNFITPQSNEWPVIQPANENQQSSRQYSIAVVPPTLEQGMRKVKHLTISMADNTEDVAARPLFYAIVYVPQGYNPQPIAMPAAGFASNNYLANQYVMSSGVLDFSAGPTRIRSKLSRNLNSGDSIYLLLATNASATNAYIAQVTYAITLQ